MKTTSGSLFPRAHQPGRPRSGRLSVVIVIVLALLAFAVAPIAKRLARPQLRPWDDGVN
jgi:hypothetical protein